jgi:hypothetical protein
MEKFQNEVCAQLFMSTSQVPNRFTP